MQDFRTEIAALQAALEQQHTVLERQQKRIGELETRIAAPAVRTEPQAEPTRRQLYAGAAAAALAGGVVLASSSPAQAANLVLGVTSNTATDPTGLAFTGSIEGNTYGIGVTDHGLDSFPGSAALAAHTQGNFDAAVLGYHEGPLGGRAGVLGISTNGVGVAGQAAGTTDQATGVQGLGGRRGVHGRSIETGVRSIGVLAEASFPTATALAVNGVLRATRVGRATIPAGTQVKTIPLSPLTGTSLVLAIARKASGTIAVQAVTVKTTSPTSFTIRLNANAPAGGMPVAWVVIDMIGGALS
jgi:hypothetical protein